MPVFSIVPRSTLLRALPDKRRRRRSAALKLTVIPPTQAPIRWGRLYAVPAPDTMWDAPVLWFGPGDTVLVEVEEVDDDGA